MRSILKRLSTIGAVGLILLASLTAVALLTGHREGLDPIGMIQLAIGCSLFVFIGRVLLPLIPEHMEADHD